MNPPFYLAVAGSAVVAVVQQIAFSIVRAGCGLRAAVQGIVRAGRKLLRAVRRHPILSSMAVVTTVLAWLFFGSAPLLSAFVLATLLFLGARLAVWLFRRLTIRPAPYQHLPYPQRNGQRVNHPAGVALVGVS